MERSPYAFYSRYPNRRIEEAEHLKCPACGADEIVILEEFKYGPAGMLGDQAQCWICKHKFTVTDNCWKPRERED